MKRLIRIAALTAGALIALFVAAIGAMFYFTSDMAKAGDSFLQDVGAGKMDSARNYLAQDFRSATSSDELRTFLERSALLDYSQSHWAQRQVSIGGTGRLEGSITTKSGGKVPLVISLVKEDGAWKIYSLQKPSAGVVTESGGQPVPSKAESSELIMGTTLAFARAVNSGDLKPFYQHTALEFQKEIPFEKFNSGFSAFIDRHVDLTLVEKVTPIFTEQPGLTADGVLVIGGYFPFTQSQVKFRYSYVYRYTDWKLIGINLNVGPAVR